MGKDPRNAPQTPYARKPRRATSSNRVSDLANYGGYRAHHDGLLGQPCRVMIASVRSPVFTLLDGIWVSHGALAGYLPT